MQTLYFLAKFISDADKFYADGKAFVDMIRGVLGF